MYAITQFVLAFTIFFILSEIRLTLAHMVEINFVHVPWDMYGVRLQPTNHTIGKQVFTLQVVLDLTEHRKQSSGVSA